MTAPIALGRPLPPPSPPKEKTETGTRARFLSQQSTPPNRVPVIDRNKVDPQTLKAAEGMEEMFLGYMMKVMRETVPKNEMDMDSPATKIYQGMMDGEMAKKADHAGGIGLADQIIAYLEAQRYNLPQGAQAPTPRDRAR